MLFIARLTTALALLGAAAVIACAVANAQTYSTQHLPNGDSVTYGSDGSGAYTQHFSNGYSATTVTPPYDPSGSQPYTRQQLLNHFCAGSC